MSAPQPPARPQHRRALGPVAAGALVGGVIAGAGAGAIDGLWSWSSSGQFLHDGLARARFVVYLAALYGLAGALVGPIVATVGALYWRHTRLGDLARAAAAAHRDTRDRDPRQALAGLSLVLVGVPVLGLTALVGFLWAHGDLAARKHTGLVVGSAMATTVAVLVVATLLTFALARPVELGLRALGDRATRALSAPWVPPVTAAALIGAAGVAGAYMAWDTLALLPLRPLWIGLLALALAAPASSIGARAVARLAPRRPAVRRGAIAGLVLAALGVALVCGNRVGVIKAAARHSGLGDGLTRALQTAGDFDRDGYSRILAGGDCDDWNAAIHPGALEIPGDGIDQNCLGGDPALVAAPARDLRFQPVPASVPRDFNIVLITIDTLRADHLGSYGYQRNTSPSIDAVAAEGTRFANGWAHAPSTRYSMPAILTGRLPLSVDYDTSISGWPGLSPDNTTIGELARNKGLSTAAVLNYWYFVKARRLDQGYQHYDNRNQRLHRGVTGEGPAKTRGSSSKEQTDVAISMLDTMGPGRFHLWVHYYDPHYEYEHHPEVEDFGRGKRDLYDSEIAYTDLHIGRLMDELRRRGEYDRTVVIITGDHGEGFGENSIDLHGYHLYAAQTRVPFIIRVPGTEPRVVETPAGHVDIAATIANLLGYDAGDPALAHADGRSLVGLITGAEPADGDGFVYQQLSYENNNEMRAVVSKRCHAIFNVSPQASWELYRLTDDPLDQVDIIDDPGDCDATRRELARWYDQAQIPRGATEAVLTERPPIERPLDVRFGDEVALLAVELPKAPVRPGARFTVTYTFEARGALPAGWKVFAHFEGPGHRFQGDHAPRWPFAWWKPGQFVRYTETVHVPPGTAPGAYRLWMGVFRGGERRPARAGAAVRIVEDRVMVGEVTVAP